MTTSFGETLRRLRTEKGLSQQQLAVRLHMERPSVANWEAGRRMPDAATVYQIAEALSVDSSALLSAADDSGEAPNVLLVDDEPLIVTGSIPALREAMPNANVVGFTKPSQALAFFSENPVALAFLDIDLGRTSGLELCREMLRLRPRTNVIYLTAFREYAFDAWDTGACGYLLKPLETETVRAQLSRLRYSVKGLL